MSNNRISKASKVCVRKWACGTLPSSPYHFNDVVSVMVHIIEPWLSACAPLSGRCLEMCKPAGTLFSHVLFLSSPVLGVVPELCQCQDLELVCDDAQLQDVPAVAVNVTMMWVKWIFQQVFISSNSGKAFIRRCDREPESPSSLSIPVTCDCDLLIDCPIGWTL